VAMAGSTETDQFTAPPTTTLHRVVA
jgi:hypothetical protein